MNPVLIVKTLSFLMLIISGFSYSVSVAKDLPFGRRFLEMAAISLSVALVSFLIGLALRELFGVTA